MIFLIRHGEPSAGWGEQADPGLSDLGRKQAEAAAQFLLKLGANSIVSSPMRRCRETAAPLEGMLGFKARIEQTVSEIIAPPGTADRSAWLQGVMTGTWSDAGDGFTLWRRALMSTLSELPDGTAVFSHFVAINAAAGMLQRDDRVMIFRPGHASITRLEKQDGWLSLIELGSEQATQVL